MHLPICFMYYMANVCLRYQKKFMLKVN
jgi:hypothetical protein